MTYRSLATGGVAVPTPVGYWSLDDTSGTTVVADVGSNGTYVNATLGQTSLTGDGAGTSVRFVAASSAEAQLPFTGLGSSTVTIAGFLKSPVANASLSHMRDNTSAGGTGWILGGSQTVRIPGTDRTMPTATYNLLRDGNRHHVALVKDGTTAYLYADGVLQDTWTVAATPTAPATPFHLCKNGTTTPYTDGYWDEVGIWNAALTAAQINTLLGNGTGKASASAESDARATATVTGPAAARAVADAGSDATIRATAAPPTAARGVASAESDARATGTYVAPAGARDVAYGESDARATATVTGPASARALGDATSDARATASALIGAKASGAASSDARATGAFVNATDNHNRVGGRDRQGHATVSWTPAVVPPPAGTPAVVLEDVAMALSVPSVGGTTAPYQPFPAVTTASKPRQRHRILVGGRDVTWFRGGLTPEPSYQLLEPLGYGAATLTFPQIRPSFERFGSGSLAWCRKGAPVVIQRVDTTTGAVVATDYRGLVIALDIDGDGVRLEVGGELVGRAAMRNKQLPLFVKTMDLGWLAYHAVADIRLPFAPFLGPTTGIKVDVYGGMGWLDYLNDLCAKAQDRQGQWTIMPGGDGRYRMWRKDTTTVHATVYVDDARVTASLRSDMAEEPNRVFVTAVAPDGRRIRGAVYPGLVQGKTPPYPMTDNSTMFPGTSDADTDTGDGISVMINRLVVMKYLRERDIPGGWDDDVSDAIRDLRKDAGRVDTPNMNPAVWKDLFDLSATGYTMRGSRIEPLAQSPKVREWNLTASGAKRSRNRQYDPSVEIVDVNVDMGTGVDSTHAHRWARAELAANATPNWVGTITVKTGAVISGVHVPGDSLSVEQVMAARDLRAGMNVWLPLWDGGTLFHVSAVDVQDSDTVQLTVDTRARDAMKVWQIVERNRASRKSPARRWLDEHRSSTMTKDSIVEWDKVGGTVPRVALDGGQWNMIQVVAGQEGIVERLRITLEDAHAEYAVAIFGRHISERRLHQLVGNPLSSSDKAKWSKESVRNRLEDDYLMLYSAGDDSAPCGYYPASKGDTPAPPLNGRWKDDAGFSYRSFDRCSLWVAIYPDRDTHLKAGRIMWDQMGAGS